MTCVLSCVVFVLSVAFEASWASKEHEIIDHCVTMYRSPKECGAPCVGGRRSLEAVSSGVEGILKGKRLAAVGDSLTRQWFETLSCALNLTATWYPLAAGKRSAETAIEAEQNGVIPMHTAPQPHDIKAFKVHGYALAEGRGLSLAYYHLDFYNETVLPFLLTKADIIVFNIGVHYNAMDMYERDMAKLFKDLSSCRAYDKKCFFRETLPQHFSTTSTGVYDPTAKRPFHCGPIPHHAKTPYNVVAANLSRAYGVPTVSVDLFHPLWRYHRKDGDCTHFCQDPIVWDRLHQSFLNAVVNDDLETTTVLDDQREEDAPIMDATIAKKKEATSPTTKILLSEEAALLAS